VEQRTTSDDPTDQDMSDVFNSAENMIRECFEELSASNLETAIFLLRQARDQLQETDPLHTNALYHLSLALHARFNHYGWMVDFEEILKSAREIYAGIEQGTFKPHVRTMDLKQVFD